MDSKSIVSVPHKLREQQLIDDSFKHAEGRENDRVALYPHQETIIQALLDIEDKRFITAKQDGEYDAVTTSKVAIEYSGVILSEGFGTGKTIEILGYIDRRPFPRPFPETLTSIGRPTHLGRATEKWWRARADTNKFNGFRTEMSAEFQKILRPNLIIVGRSVLLQWKTAIETFFPNLLVLMIGNFHDLEKFYKKYQNNTVNTYDIVLVKNGNVTGNFKVDGESSEDAKTTRPLINVIAKISAGAAWARVIYDDFDTINIHSDAGGLHGLFYVYVSATRKTTPTTRNRVITYKNVIDAIKQRSSHKLLDVVRDDIMFTNINIKNDPNFTEESLKIPRINMYKYVYSNPDDNYIKLLGAMGEADANVIMEMLNGDAIATAAETLGIKTDSIASIFERMLDKKYEKYINDGKILKTIDEAKEHIGTLEYHPKDRHSAVELEHYRTNLIKKMKPTFIAYTSRALETFLDELYAEFRQSREKNGVAINRVKDNLREGDCQVCCLPLHDPSQETDVSITKCCGLVTCSECLAKTFQIKKTVQGYGRTADKAVGSLAGKCPNCMAVVDLTCDVIYINKEFDLESLLEAEGDEQEEPEPIKQEEPEEPEDKLPEIKNPKLKALLAIISGKIPESRSTHDVPIKHLLAGRVDMPQTNDVSRKVLVFANFNETLKLIENFLREQNIEYLRLGGTFSQMNDCINKFRTHGTVLLINSSQHCAGLNIQFATDVVFFHKIMDENIESQVAGRAQRIGRKVNLKIHYLLYANEQALV